MDSIGEEDQEEKFDELFDVGEKVSNSIVEHCFGSVS